MSNQINQKEFNFFSAENLTRLVSDAILQSNPTTIDIFDYNILKAKILLISAECISEIIEKIHPRLGKKDFGIKDSEDETPISNFIEEVTKLATSGSAIYLGYTEQSIVCAVTASETYFRDRLAKALTIRPELVNQFADKEIKIKKILEINFDVKNEIGNLIVEKNLDFQNLEGVSNIYQKVFGEEIFKEEELIHLKKIFQIRHLIIHRGGIVDSSFITKTHMPLKIGNRFMLSREEVKNIIEFIAGIVHRTEKTLSEKLGDTKAINISDQK